MATYLQNLSASGEVAGLVTMTDPIGFKLLTILSLTTGAVFIMWLGEQINNRGIGNGISLVIFAGIVARLPNALFTLYEQAIGDTTGTVGLSMYQVLLLAVIVTATIAFICCFEKAQRRNPPESPWAAAPANMPSVCLDAMRSRTKLRICRSSSIRQALFRQFLPVRS